MDCMCCADGGVGPASDSEFLGSLCRLNEGTAKFPVEGNGRYKLYVVAGCPFAARPWICAALYGLTKDAIQVIKCFPASHEDGWFLQPKSLGEEQLVQAFPDAKIDTCPKGSHHLRQLYFQAKPDFKGAISVPLLWDSKQDTVVSNSSLGLAEMICTQMKVMATRNIDLELFPSRLQEPALYQEHEDLVHMLHGQVTTVVYKIFAIWDGKERDSLVDKYYETLEALQNRLNEQPFLMGELFRFADIVLFISLVRLDLVYQWRFGLGRKNVRENFPGLMAYTKRIMDMEGVAETVLPRDIMALYFLTLKYTKNVNLGRALPQVPLAWEEKCGRTNTSEKNGGCK